MSNELPASISLFGREIQIIYSRRLEVESIGLKASDYEDAIGAAANIHNKIYISTAVPKMTQRSTLLHELLHIVSDSLNLDLTESQVCGLESGLFSIIEDIKYKE